MSRDPKTWDHPSGCASHSVDTSSPTMRFKPCSCGLVSPTDEPRDSAFAWMSTPQLIHAARAEAANRVTAGNTLVDLDEKGARSAGALDFDCADLLQTLADRLSEPSSALSGRVLAIRVTPPGPGRPGWQAAVDGFDGLGYAETKAAAVGDLLLQLRERVGVSVEISAAGEQGR